MPPVKSDRRLRILLIDDHLPYPELGVGYPRARKLLQALDAMGHAVALAPLHGTGDSSAKPDVAHGVVLGVVPGFEREGLRISLRCSSAQVIKRQANKSSPK